MKKKFYYAGMLAAGLLTFASCNNDEDPIIDQNQVQTEEEAGQVIRIAVANAGDGLETRAGRPLFSSEAAQTIDKVKVVIVDAYGQIQATKLFENWQSESSPYNEDGHGREAVWKLSGDDKLADTESNATYRVYAIGYTSAGSMYDFTDFSSASIYYKLPVAKTIETSESFAAEEVFAGEIPAISVADGQIVTTVGGDENVLTLHRQVTGVIGYYTGIPTYALGKAEDGTEGIHANKAIENLKLRMVATNINDKIVFDHFNQNVMINNGQNTEDRVDYVVNGMQNAAITPNAAMITGETNSLAMEGTATGYLLYQINLKDWFPLGDVNEDGILDENDAATVGGWNTPASVQGATFKEGSVFAGEFLIPFAAIRANANPAPSSKTTLQLQLVKDDGSKVTPVRVWDIRLDANDPQVYDDPSHIWAVSSTDDGYTFEPQVDEDESAQYYSLVRNHLYTVGEKTSDAYDPETDDPEDLSKGMNLILRVNDNWELIHRMEVE